MSYFSVWFGDKDHCNDYVTCDLLVINLFFSKHNHARSCFVDLVETDTTM